MSKRFVDTNLGREPWFRKLSPKLKCAVRFLFDECDNVGIWVIDMEMMAFFIGEDISLDEIFSINSDKTDRIEKYSKDKIFIPGFVSFQYGTLTESCNPHKPIIQKLKKLELYERVMGRVPIRLSNNLKEKDKEQNKDKDFLEEYEKPFELPEKNVSGHSSNVETTVLANQIEFESICMTSGKPVAEVKTSLTKYHLYLERESKYPMARKALFSGFKLWLMNEKPTNGNHGLTPVDIERQEKIKNYKFGE